MPSSAVLCQLSRNVTHVLPRPVRYQLFSISKYRQKNIAIFDIIVMTSFFIRSLLFPAAPRFATNLSSVRCSIVVLAFDSFWSDTGLFFLSWRTKKNIPNPWSFSSVKRFIIIVNFEDEILFEVTKQAWSPCTCAVVERLQVVELS